MLADKASVWLLKSSDLMGCHRRVAWLQDFRPFIIVPLSLKLCTPTVTCVVSLSQLLWAAATLHCCLDNMPTSIMPNQTLSVGKCFAGCERLCDSVGTKPVIRYCLAQVHKFYQFFTSVT